MILTIDPGTKHIGWAIFDSVRLYTCGLARSASKDLAESLHATYIRIPKEHKIDLVLCERPTTRGKENPAREQDLIDLGIAAGASLSLARGSRWGLVKPSTWKGSQPKEICTERILESLTAYELAVLNSVNCPN